MELIGPGPGIELKCWGVLIVGFLVYAVCQMWLRGRQFSNVGLPLYGGATHVALRGESGWARASGVFLVVSSWFSSQYFSVTMLCVLRLTSKKHPDLMRICMLKPTALLGTGHSCWRNLFPASASAGSVVPHQQWNRAELGWYGSHLGSHVLQHPTCMLTSFILGFEAMMTTFSNFILCCVWVKQKLIVTSLHYLGAREIIHGDGIFQVDPSETKILLTDPPLNPTRNREKMVCFLTDCLVPDALADAL